MIDFVSSRNVPFPTPGTKPAVPLLKVIHTTVCMRISLHNPDRVSGMKLFQSRISIEISFSCFVVPCPGAAWFVGICAPEILRLTVDSDSGDSLFDLDTVSLAR